MKRLAWTIVLALGLARAGAQETVWNYVPPAGHVDISPAVADLYGDGRTEIVVGTTAGFVIALNARGREIWRQNIGDAISVTPSIADVNGDGALEVLAMNRRGLIACLNGRSGDVIWETRLNERPQWGATSLAVGDLFGDGAMEVVTGTRDGTVVCLKAASGDQLWRRKTGFGPMTSPAIVDLNGDGRAEVLVGSEKVSLLCLDAHGKELWRRGDGIGASPIAYKAGANSAPMILTGMGKSLCALDARGKTLWTIPMKREIDGGISVADADGDGSAKVYAVDLAGHLVCASLRGKVRWMAEVQERARRSPSIGDVDGDGKMEILVAGYSRAVHVFDAHGKLKVAVPLAGPSNSTATLAVLGGALCVVVSVSGEPLHVFRWPGAHRNARRLWSEYRHDSRRSGWIAPPAKPSPVRITTDFGGMRVGAGTVRADVRNPERHRLTVRLESTSDSGITASTQVVSTEARIRGLLRYTMPGTGVTAMTLTCRVADGPRTVARRSRTMYLNVFHKELATVAQAVAESEKRLPKLPDRRGIEDRVCLLSVKLAALRPRISGAGPISETERVAGRKALAGLLVEARAVRRLAAEASEATASGSTVKLCSANPWAPFGGLDELAERRATSTVLSVAAFGGETECAALNVFNMCGQARTFRVELAQLSHGADSVRDPQAVKLFEVVDVPTERCDMSADALAPLGVANLLQVPAWSARQLWLNVDTHGLAPGEWKGTVRLRSLDVAPVEVSAPLKVTVWNAHLPAKQALRNCGWGYVESSMLKDYPAEAVVDQVEHGTNVFVSTFAPNARFDVEGNLIGAPDFADHDAYVRKYAAHGIILFCGYQGALQGPAPEGSEAYRKAHIKWLRAWMKHLAELGLGYDGFALYPVDEPGLNNGLVAYFLRMAKLAREADPRIRIYTDPVQGISEAELREMRPYVDIWCPNRSGIVINPKSQAKLDIIKATGKSVWMYECADNAKHQSPIGYYRAQAWLAWSHGLSGIGFWSYCTSQDDPWFTPSLRYDYLLVYPGAGVVSSKRWEAVRDGVEDYSMLTALRRKLDTDGLSANPEDVSAAKRLLGEQAERVGRFCHFEDGDLLPEPDALPSTRRLEDAQWAALQTARSEIARLLDRL